MGKSKGCSIRSVADETFTRTTGVNINKTNITLLIGATEQLSATVTPTNATNQNITWSSSNANIVSVSNTGVITAQSAGTAIITVTTANGNKKATCTVTVTTSALAGCTDAKAKNYNPAATENDGSCEYNKTAVETIAAKEIAIYPNPVKNELFIKTDLPVTKVEISSLTGALLLVENNVSGKISVTSLPQGIYVLKVYTNKGIITSKIMKE